MNKDVQFLDDITREIASTTKTQRHLFNDIKYLPVTTPTPPPNTLLQYFHDQLISLLRSIWHHNSISKMQSKPRFGKESRFDRTSLLGKLFYSYIFPVFVRAYRNNGLSQDDLDECPKQDRVEQHAARLLRNWNRSKTEKTPKFWWILIRTFGLDYIVLILMNFFEEIILRITGALCLGLVIKYFSAGEVEISYRDACYAAAVICLCSALYPFTYFTRDILTNRIGMRVRTACCSLMFQKALRLSQASVGQTSVGQIVNLMSNDVGRIEEFGVYMPYLLTGPIQLALITYIVWTYMGVSCFFAMGILSLLIPLQFSMAKLFSRIRSGTATLTDTRLRLMHEIVSGMRVIKMYCWERPFAERVAQARKSEVTNIRKGLNLEAFNMSIFQISSQFSLFVCLLSYILFGHSLNAEAVFVSMVLFNILQGTMTGGIPYAIQLGAELLITCQRIENFLMLEEFQSDKLEDKTGKHLNDQVLDSRNKSRSNSVRIIANNISAKWNSALNQPTLKEVSLSLKPGDLLTVIGPVGSGKSSLLMALLGELPLDGGDILREGRLSYAGQQPWIFNDTVYNNILLGLDYNHRRYQKVLEACALNRDLELWPFGDQTLVGEKGVQLSGGQKARIEMARAVYRRADIYLLDDPLSAVDAGVADHIFEKCILEHLQNKVRVLATHQIQFIQKATKVLVLKEGQSLAYGSYEELREQGVDFVSLLAESEDVDHTSVAEKEKACIEPSEEEAKENDFNTTEDSDYIAEEEYQSGSINGRVYREYIRAASSPLMFIVLVVSSLLTLTANQGSSIFLSAWTDKNQLLGPQQDQQTDILVYSGLVAILFIVSIIRAVSFYDLCLRASENLHHQIFVRLLRTPLSFFDSNPVGRILNRFSKDVGIMDELLVTTGFFLNQWIGHVVSTVVTICLLDWFMFGPSLVLAILCFYARRFYIVAARDLRRFEGVARSPVFSHVSTSISGLVSIRAFGTESSFLQQFHNLQDDHSASYFLVISSSAAVTMLIDSLCLIYTCGVIGSVMLIPGLQGGSAGLIISSAMMMAGYTSWFVMKTADFESQFTSVERIVEYQNLEQEAPAESDKELKPDKDWPAQGKIQFDKLCLIYGNNQDKPVLKNLSFVVKAGEKVGIVGRTGAGKSSMIAALFRLTEPSGVIRIDGVDIQSIGLDDLRRKISIIPQDPVIYSGTIRYNLDPFCQYADFSLWDALDHVQLRATVTNLEGQLDAQLNDSGSNLSVGQRQLICLARAILRRNQILVLDEATANIDHQTDSLIQQTIRSQFSACTVLTIAHRLPSIIDSDRVLVLDAGQIVEFDVPYLLLQRQTAFYEMCQKTGPNMYAHLLRAAKLAHENSV